MGLKFRYVFNMSKGQNKINGCDFSAAQVQGLADTEIKLLGVYPHWNFYLYLFLYLFIYNFYTIPLYWEKEYFFIILMEKILGLN